MSEESTEIVTLEPAEETLGPYRLPGLLRGFFVVFSAILLTLLGIAASLTPSADGFGTHRQIKLPLITGAEEGLPACSFLQAYGKPCPSCGMTTSWAWLMKGNLWESVRANVAGTLLGICALVSAPWLLASAIAGRFWPGAPNEKVVLVIGVGVMLTTLINWIVRLF